MHICVCTWVYMYACACMPGRSVTECPQDTRVCRPEERPLAGGTIVKCRQAACVEEAGALVLPQYPPLEVP